MRKNRMVVWLAIVMAAMLTLSACGKKTALNEAMQNAWAASKDMESFTFDGSFVIDELHLPAGSQVAGDLSYLETLGNVSVSFRGAYNQDPLRMEITLKLTIPGDAAFTVEVPVILTDDKMYVRIPSIPLLPLGDAAGRFVEIDLAELEGQAGALSAFDVELQRKLSVDVLNILTRHLDEESYLRELKREDVPGLPGDVKADRYVQLRIGEDNFEAFARALVERIAPEIIDLLLENESYRSALRLSEEGLRRMKEELAADGPDSPRNRLEALKENIAVREISMTGAIKDGRFVWQLLKGNVEAENNGEKTAVNFTFNIRYDNINQDVTFEHDIPEDALSLEAFGQLFFGSLF